MRFLALLVAVIFVFGSRPGFAAAPCDGVNLSLTAQQKTVLAPIFVRQLKEKRPDFSGLPDVTKVDVDSAARGDGWSVYYVGPNVADDAVLFYSGDPRTHEYLTFWTGWDPDATDRTIIDWEVAKMPAIPRRFAACFAWLVLHDEKNWGGP